MAKKYFSNEEEEESKVERINSKLLMTAMMGICGCLTLWPGLLILDRLDIEVFELPTSRADVLSLAIPAMMDTLYTTSFIVGISMTDPVFMAVAQLFVIPVSFFYDVMFDGLIITLFAALGTMLIFFGFLLMELPIRKYMARRFDNEDRFRHYSDAAEEDCQLSLRSTY